MTKRMKVYKAKDGWRWQLWSSSDIIAESGEAMSDRGYAVKMARSFDSSAVLEVEQCEEEPLYHAGNREQWPDYFIPLEDGSPYDTRPQ